MRHRGVKCDETKSFLRKNKSLCTVKKQPCAVCCVGLKSQTMMRVTQHLQFKCAYSIQPTVSDQSDKQWSKYESLAEFISHLVYLFHHLSLKLCNASWPDCPRCGHNINETSVYWLCVWGGVCVCVCVCVCACRRERDGECV